MAAGLEPAAAGELRRLGLTAAAQRRGVVVFRATAADGVRAALNLRCASRVVHELRDGVPAAPATLREGCSVLPWEEFLPARAPWAVRVVGTNLLLRHTVYTARLVKDAIRDRFSAVGRTAPPVDPRRPKVIVDVRIDRDAATLGFDMGGGSLHRRRGPRRGGVAALHEDVAAGLALLAGVKADQPLLDPFCGSGTLVAEAAAVALRVAPRRDVARMALARLPAFRGLGLPRIASEQRDRTPPPHAPFLAFDRDGDAVRRAEAVLREMGLSQHVQVRRAAAPELPLPALPPGLLLSNPPWGLRFDQEDAGAAWSSLGRLAHGRLAGWRLALLSGTPGATRSLGLRAERRWPVLVGGVDARLLLYRVRP